MFERNKLKRPAGDGVVVDATNCTIMKNSVSLPGVNGFSVVTGSNNAFEKNKFKTREISR